jgi:hypothetical protein
LKKRGGNLSVREIRWSGSLSGIETNASAVVFVMFIVPMELSIGWMTAFSRQTRIGVKDAVFAIENVGLEPSAWPRRNRYG